MKADTKERARKKNKYSGDEFWFTALKISASGEVFLPAGKNYRRVYAAQEVQNLFADIEGINKRVGDQDWKAEMEIVLFRLEGEKPVCMAQKETEIEVNKELSVFVCEVSFAAEDIGENCFPVGVYGIVARIGGKSVQSDPVYLMEGNGEVNNYLRVKQVGIDKCCEETPEEASARLHSFRTLDRKGLKDVRFYFFAENLREEDWVYEFIISLTDHTGRMKAMHTVQGKQFIKDGDGRSVLCFALDLGEGREHFWQLGEYFLNAYAFDRLMLRISFTLSDEDIPYDYAGELAVWGHPKASVRDRNAVMEQIYQLAGLRKVKEEVTRISEYVDFIKMRQANGFEDVFEPMHLWFTGNPGAGRHKVARLLGELGVSLGLLSHGKVNYYHRKDLLQGGGNIENALRKRIAENVGGIMFIEDAGDFYDDTLPEDKGLWVLALLNEMLIREKPSLLVILSDKKSEIDLLKGVLPDLQQNFRLELFFEDYAPEELMEITRLKLKERRFGFDAAAAGKFMKLLRERSLSKETEVCNGRFLEEEISNMTLRMARRLMSNRKATYSKQEMMLIGEEDVAARIPNKRENSLKQLEEWVGSDELKQNLLHHLNYVYFIRERRKFGFDDVMPSLNMIFSGNPGTGKLTVAKMLAEIYCSAGIINQSGVMIQNARELLGATAVTPQQLVRTLLDESAGGILYIEECCAFLQTQAGTAVFETLLSSVFPYASEGNVIILADTPGEIDRMMQLNPGINIYFPFHFHFSDHTPDQLLDIAVCKLKEKNFVLHPKAKIALEKIIRKVYGERDKHFGNALWIEKMLEVIIRRMSDRLMKVRQDRELTMKEVNTVMESDIPVYDEDIPGFKKEMFDEENIRKVLTDMDQFVGQAKIKRQIRDFVDLARHYSRQGIKLNTRLSLQWCFTGNTGMGKRALARIIARLYKAMGIVEKTEVTYLQVEKLTGLLEEEAQHYIGKSVQEAQGGILLWDEDAEQVMRMEGLRERARAILMNQMALNPGACVIIYVGQRPTVESFKTDGDNVSGLINIVRFENYSNDELMLMLKRKLSDENMKLTVSAQQHMCRFIERLTSTEERSKASARLIRSVAAWIVQNCERRLSKNGKIHAGKIFSVTISDVRNFDESLLVFLMNERRKIGFTKNE